MSQLNFAKILKEKVREVAAMKKKRNSNLCARPTLSDYLKSHKKMLQIISEAATKMLIGSL